MCRSCATGHFWPSFGADLWPIFGEDNWPIFGEDMWPIIARETTTTQLTDASSDAVPVGVEPGNLATLGDLTGATVVAIDTLQGHYVYRRTITAHNTGAGGGSRWTGFASTTAAQTTPGWAGEANTTSRGCPSCSTTPVSGGMTSRPAGCTSGPRAPGDPAGQEIEISLRV